MCSKLREHQLHLRFKILMAVTMKIAVFLDVTPCSLANGYSHLGECVMSSGKRYDSLGIWKGRLGTGLGKNQQEITVQSGNYSQ
jgi:hypothetical protein